MEEPEQGLFGQQLPTDSRDAVAMTTIQQRYNEVLDNVTCKVYMFRHRNNSIVSMNETLIFKPLMDRTLPFFLGLTDFPFRRISQEDIAKEVPNPRFLYDTESTKKITQTILYFIQQEGERPLLLLHEESREPRSSNRASALLNQFDYMTKRLEALTSEYVDNASTEVDNSVDAGDGL